ncbi:tRNA-splicing endonuclease subunit Sen15 [Thelonectria olida]|uniref:tRNA-splicing endonuclease subunit Sen15 n=1 Tax=Thelonectria olida TaxID=1576542 RepID=A0A9P8W604_9HYPO|nr:tRNA-splicing endonuclease subunit Sen15 [Thelonectria olida]
MTLSHSPVAGLTSTVLGNLENQHDWTSLQIHDEPGQRPLIRGLPSRRLYIHPDDQIAALTHEEATGQSVTQNAEYEWVLPVHLEEKWTLGDFAAVFDSIQHAGPRAKRVLLATVHNDSTVVYYFMHEGIVKPRQN